MIAGRGNSRDGLPAPGAVAVVDEAEKGTLTFFGVSWHGRNAIERVLPISGGMTEANSRRAAGPMPC
jgi:hypothetical protein